MSKLAELGFSENDEQDIQDLADLPEQFSGFTPPPQPGKGYIIELPTITADDDGWGSEDAPDGKRYPTYTFDPRSIKRVKNPDTGEMDEIDNTPNPLTVVMGPDESAIDAKVRWRVSGRPRERKVAGAVVKFSALAYLIRAVLGPRKLVNAVDYTEALIECSGKQFKSDLDWTARCSPDRDKYGIDAEGNPGVIEGEVGCGQGYGTRRYKIRNGERAGQWVELISRKALDNEGNEVVPDEDGNIPVELVKKRVWADRFMCGSDGCGALLSPFLEFSNFQPLTPHVAETKPATVKHAAPAVAPKPAPKPAPAPAKTPAPAIKKPVPPVHRTVARR